VVSHFSAQLSDAAPGEKVRVAGIVTRVRPHQTKTGKSMGFVTLEDLQGNIELVVFPRTWEQFWDVFEVDSVVLVDGKVDAQSGDPKVLVDSVTTDLKTIGPVIKAPVPTLEPPISRPSLPNPEPPIFGSETATPGDDRPDDWGDTPPPPDEFPTDWKALEVAPGGFILEVGGKITEVMAPAPAAPEVVDTSHEPAVIEQAASSPTQVSTPTILEQAPVIVPPAPAAAFAPTPLELKAPVADAEASALHVEIPTKEPGVPDADTLNLQTEVATVGSEKPILATQVAAQAAELSIAKPEVSDALLNTEVPISRTEVPSLATAVPPYILPPAEAYAGQDLHMITVILRTCTDKVRDNLRLRQCYGILISYSGHDRFALQIFERNRGYRIEFPNYTTLFSPELIGRLASIVGADNIIVEPLRLH